MKKDKPQPAGQIQPEDVELFRSMVGAVTPLVPDDRALPSIPPRKPLYRQRQPNTPSAIPVVLSDSSSGDTPAEFLSNGMSRMTLRKLRRGTWPIQDRLDLHGFNSDGARKMLQAFLHMAAQHDYRCVLLVHGKGLNSQGGEAVLRRLVRHWLTQHPLVLAFCDAPPKDGGSGAVLVLLRVNP